VNAAGIAAYAVLGVLIASACWVVAFAQANKLPLFGGPVCAACHGPLPALAWLPFWGLGSVRRCAACEAVQPRRRVGFELAVGGYFALVAARAGDVESLVAVAVFSAPLLVILLVDWWTRFIYTNVIAAGLLAGFAFAALDGLGSLLHALAGAAGGAGIFLGFYLLAAVIYRSVKVVPFGLGDVYLAGMIGAMIGSFLAVIAALFYGIFLAGAGAFLLLATRRVQRRQPIPYGPYLCGGALLALLLQASG
jgi:leader peptidase (prepilin peptidase)/N-methyltransferase